MGYNEDFTRIMQAAQRVEKTATGGDFVAVQLLLTTLRYSAHLATEPRTIAMLRNMERYVSVIGNEPRLGYTAGDTRLAAEWCASLIREFVGKHGG